MQMTFDKRILIVAQMKIKSLEALLVHSLILTKKKPMKSQARVQTPTGSIMHSNIIQSFWHSLLVGISDPR
jgi:hypothetical protein